MNIKDFMSHGGKAIEFNSDALAVLRGPGVYMYCVGDKAVYVGSASNLTSRAFSRGHGKAKEFRMATSVLLFPCKTKVDALKLEAEMIADLHPTLNGYPMRHTFVSDVAHALGISPRDAARAYPK